MFVFIRINVVCADNNKTDYFEKQKTHLCAVLNFNYLGTGMEQDIIDRNNKKFVEKLNSNTNVNYCINAYIIFKRLLQNANIDLTRDVELEFFYYDFLLRDEIKKDPRTRIYLSNDEEINRLRNVVKTINLNDISIEQVEFDLAIKEAKEMINSSKERDQKDFNDLSVALGGGDKTLIEYDIKHLNEAIEWFKSNGKQKEADSLFERIEKLKREGKLEKENVDLLKQRQEFLSKNIKTLQNKLREVEDVKFLNVKDLHKNLKIDQKDFNDFSAVLDAGDKTLVGVC